METKCFVCFGLCQRVQIPIIFCHQACTIYLPEKIQNNDENLKNVNLNTRLCPICLWTSAVAPNFTILFFSKNEVNLFNIP